MNKKGNKVTLLYKRSYSDCVEFGISRLKEELVKVDQVELLEVNYFTQLSKQSKICLIVGLISNPFIRKLVSAEKQKANYPPETIIYENSQGKSGKNLIISGSDAVGLMYALLEMSQRIEANGLEAINCCEDLIEYPDNESRAVSRFLMSHRDDSWFYNEDFWNYYFARLACNRFNTFVLITGFDTAYMAPPYPFFLAVKGYEEVVVEGMKKEQIQRNLEMLCRIGQLCHRYGIAFEFAIWQQMPWTTNPAIITQIEKHNKNPWEAKQMNLVCNLPKEEEKLGQYAMLGLQQLLEACKVIDILQLRVNFEAGVGTTTTNNQFWMNLVKVVADLNRPIELKLRAKGLTEQIIQYALELGVELTIPTKYWCEHLSLPYHMNVLRSQEMASIDNENSNLRYSYGSLLKKPHYYDVTYRLWNYGSNTIFLWGDADYGKRFSQSIPDAQGKGYEITAPLSLKGGQISIPGEEWPLFDDENYIHYKYEDERYWAWYLFFGRLGYNALAKEEVWKREFRKHFNSAADDMEEAYSYTSKIMPMITTAHFPIHPSLQYWPELSTGGALFAEHNFNTWFDQVTYGSALPSDEGLFYGVEEYLEDFLKGNLEGKYTPFQIRYWYQYLADGAQKAINSAISNGLDTTSKEINGTLLDMNLLSHLALYHSEKIMSALYLSYYNKMLDKKYLNDSIYYMERAKNHWDVLCDKGSAYHYDLQFSASHGDGRARALHWKDRRVELEQDLVKLYNMNGPGEIKKPDNQIEILNKSILFEINLPQTLIVGKDYKVQIDSDKLFCEVSQIKMHYRHMNHLEGYFKEVLMEKSTAGFYAIIPGEYITKEWDIMIYFTSKVSEEEMYIYPGIMNPYYRAPYFIVQTKG